VANRVLVIRLVQWLGRVFENKERKKERARQFYLFVFDEKSFFFIFLILFQKTIFCCYVSWRTLFFINCFENELELCDFFLRHLIILATHCNTLQHEKKKRVPALYQNGLGILFSTYTDVGVIGCQTSGAGRYSHTKWGVFHGTFIVNLMYLNLPCIWNWASFI